MQEDLKPYLDALEGQGPLALDWKDKPHRLVYDLIERVVTARGVAAELTRWMDSCAPLDLDGEEAYEKALTWRGR